MKNILQKIKNHYTMKRVFSDAKRTVLRKDEKEQGQEDLIAFMKKHPVRNLETTRHNLQRSSAFSKLQLTHSLKPMPLLLTVALLFSLGGGVSFAAQESLPNDPLYPVKIHVNERVESAIAFNNEAKAEVAFEKAELRLQEAEVLATEGELSEGVTSKVETRFNSQIQRLSSLEAKLEAKGNAEAAAQIRSRVEAMLQVHEQVLTKLETRLRENEKESSENISKIRTRVDRAAQAAVKARTDAEAKTSAEVDSNSENKTQAAQALLQVAETKFNNTIEFKNRVESRSQAQANTDAKVHLETAEELLIKGRAQIEAGNNQEAFLTLHQALRSTQKAHSLIATSVHLKIDLNSKTDAGTRLNTSGEEDTNTESETNTDIEAETDTKTKIDAGGLETNASWKARAKARIEF